MDIVSSLRRWWVRRVWAHSPHCDAMCRLASRSLDEPLPWSTRMRVRLHFLVCVYCRRYARQLRTLRDRARSRRAEPGDPSGPGLSEGARNRIRRRIRDEAKDCEGNPGR